MISPPVRALLDAIGKVEAGERGYNAMYLPAERKLGKRALTVLRVVEVQSLQNRMVKVSASSAIGRYQFIRATLAGLVKEMGLSGKERFDEDLQDRLAERLLQRRGLTRFIAGNLSREAFANNLAMEWASLPVVTPINGKDVGESYYAGDGLNYALMKPGTILAALDALKAPQKPAQPPKPIPPSMPPPDVDPGPEPSADGPVPIPRPKPKLTRWQAFWLAVTGGAASFGAWIADNAELVMGGVAVAVVGAVAWVVWKRRG